MKKKFNEIVRTLSNSLIAGVCGALAEYFNIDVVLVRIVWLVFALFYGAGILLYFVAALVLPNKSEIEG